MFLSGVLILSSLSYGWATYREWVVLTIFPMMGIPYFVGVGLIVKAFER